MGRRGEGEGEGSGPRFEDARIVEEPSRRMTAAAVTLSRGCAERIRDGIGASTSEASASETRRARREFADGGSATGTSSLRDDSGFISLTYTPRKPTATFLRASPLDRARVEFGPSIYSGGSSAPGDDADGSGAARDDAPSRDPTNDASPRPGNPGACGDDGGVVIDATVNRRRSVHQLSFLSNLAERRRWDDASVATKWTLLEPGRRTKSRPGDKTDSPRRWWSFLRPGYLRTGNSPEVSADASLHWDSFGDATVEVEIKKQAPTHAVTAPGAGSAAFLRGGRLARVTAVSEAFVANLRGPNPTLPRVEVNLAGEIGAAGDPTKPPVYVRGKLTSDLADAGAHWLAFEARAGEGGTNTTGGDGNGNGNGNGNGRQKRMRSRHLRFFTDFKNSHALRLRHASRSRASAPAPGAPSWRCAVAQNLTSIAVGSGFRGVGFNCESNVEVTVRCARGDESPSDESYVGGELRFDAKVARDAARVARAAIRASSSTPRASSSSSSDAVDTIRSVECAVSSSKGVEGVGFEWRREWRARDVVRGDRDDDSHDDGGDTAVGDGGDRVEAASRFASVRVTAIDPRGGGPSAFCEFNALGTPRDDPVFGRCDERA